MARPLPQEEAGPRLRVHARRVVSLRLLVVLSGVLFFGVLFGAVAIQAQRIEGQRQIDELDRSIATQRDRYRSLRAEVAQRESPERIMDAARALDMVEPGPVAPLVAGTTSTPATTAPDATAQDPTQDTTTQDTTTQDTTTPDTAGADDVAADDGGASPSGADGTTDR